MRATVGCARGVDAGRASEGIVGQHCGVICFRLYVCNGLSGKLKVLSFGESSLLGMNYSTRDGVCSSGALSFQNLREISRLIGRDLKGLHQDEMQKFGVAAFVVGLSRRLSTASPPSAPPSG